MFKQNVNRQTVGRLLALIASLAFIGGNSNTDLGGCGGGGGSVDGRVDNCYLLNCDPDTGTCEEVCVPYIPDLPTS